MAQSQHLFVGCTFSCENDFNRALKDLEDEHNCSFVFKNSVKAECDNKRRKRPIPLDKFSLARGTVATACSHFGKKRAYPSKGVKTCTKSQKLQCTAAFSFTFDDFGQCLVITKCQLDHSHETDATTYAQQRKQKQFTEEEKAILKEVVALNPDNEKLLVMVQNDFKKSLCLNDIRMLKHKLRTAADCGGDIDSIARQLQKIKELGGHCSVDLSRDDQQNHLLEMVAFSTKEMVECFKSFPECIFIDGTYKKNNSGYPLYQIMVEDCLGKARPVFYAFIRKETTAIITLVLEAFAEYMGDEVKKVQVVMTDKCASETAAIKKVLPWARHLLCHWHVYAAMERKAKQVKIDRAQKRVLTHLHIKLRNTLSVAEFLALEGQMEVISKEFFDYYVQQWQPCRTMWAACDRINVTNNFVESENGRLGKILSSSKSLSSAVYNLHNHSIVQMNELTQGIIDTKLSTVTYQVSDDRLVPLYGKFFPYAVKEMIKNHSSIHDTLAEDIHGLGNTWIVTDRTGARFKVTLSDNVAQCHCPFFSQTTLPCVHICCCMLNGLSAEVYHHNNRWLLSRRFVSSSDMGHSSAAIRECLPAERRHYKTEALLNNVSNALKSCGGAQFQNRFDLLNSILTPVLRMWEEGHEIDVHGANVTRLVDALRGASVENLDVGDVVSLDGNGVGEVVSLDGNGVGDVVGVDGNGVAEVVGVDGNGVGDVVGVDGNGVGEVVSLDGNGVGEVVSLDGNVVGEVDVHGSNVTRVVDALIGASDVVNTDGDGVGEMDANGALSETVVVTRENIGVAEPLQSTSSISLEEACQLQVNIPSIRPRGRPAKPRTNKGKVKRARHLYIDETICHLCLKSELDREKSNGSGYDSWTRCPKCVRWFHDVCIEDKGVLVSEYVCAYH